MIGTSDIYEYAATEIGPINFLANLDATNIDVGPSAAPIIPIAADVLGRSLNWEC